MSDEALIAIAKEWLPDNPAAVLRAIIAYPGSDLARVFRLRIAETKGKS